MTVLQLPCKLCGHPVATHGRRCPKTCAGCGRDLEEVAEGAAYGCKVCLRYLRLYGNVQDRLGRVLR